MEDKRLYLVNSELTFLVTGFPAQQGKAPLVKLGIDGIQIVDPFFYVFIDNHIEGEGF